MHKTRLALLTSKLISAVVLISLILVGLQIGGGTASAATQTGIQPLAANGGSFYYYVDGQRFPLVPSLDWVSVKFTSTDSAKQTAALSNSGTLLGSLDQARRIPKPELTLLPVQKGITVQTLVQGINSMRAMPANFTEVNPVFQTADAEMAITDQFIATFPAGKSMEDINAINLSYGVEVVEPILGQDNTFILELTAGTHLDALAVANLYQESGLAVNAAPNFVRILQVDPANSVKPENIGPMATPNDTYYTSQWSLNNTQQYGAGMVYDADIDAPEAWDLSIGSSSVIIAVIDEGVDLTHEDLSGKLVAGYDATGGGSSGGPWGDDAHGTNVAGIAAANTNNSMGVAGVCPNCRIMPVRIAYGSGGNWITYDSWIANGITWAYQNGAYVLNNSWGGGSPSTVINNAFTNAKTLGRGGKGSVIVVSAGNSDFSTVSYPASLSTVIAVAASNMCDQRKTPTNDLCNGYEYWWGSNYGSALDISAPGVWLDSTDIMGAAGYSSTNYYSEMNGTSGAAPVVSGVAGLVLSVNPSFTADQVQTTLQGTADDVNGGGWDTTMGYGRVNAYRAVQSASPWIGSVSITSNKNIVAVGRPHIGSEITSYDSFSAGALTAYIPMLFKNAYGGSYDSALYIQNVHASNTATISIKYYSSTGFLNCTVPDSIGPLASKGYWLPSLLATCLPDGWTGGAVITSNQPIVANGRPHIGTEVMTYDNFSAGSLTAYLPMLFKNAYGGTYDFAFYVQNVSESNTANINIYYYTSAGALSCTVSDTVAPLASKGYWLPSLAASCLPDGWVGGVVVTSNQPIVTVGRPHIGSQVTTYNGFSGGSLTSYLPMLFKDAYGGSYDTALYIQNVSGTLANINIKFYTSAGALSCTYIDSIASLASKGYWLPSISATCLPAGWVGSVVVTSNQAIVAIGRPHIGTQITTYNGFTSGNLSSYLPMLFKVAYGTYNSAFYVQNTEGTSASVTTEFYDSSGALTCTSIDTLAAFSTLSVWTPNLTCLP